jgi:chitin synthase
MAEAEAGINVHSIGNLYAPYAFPGLPQDDYADPFNHASSQAHIPLMANAQRGDFYNDEYEDRKLFHSDDFDNWSRLTSNWEETNSNYGSESYAPSRNMFQNVDKEGLITREALAGDIMENETTKVVKEMSAHWRWVLLCWLLTWWILSIFLKWFGRMKRQDIRQAWREKLALNFIIWFICTCVVFVITILGLVICPTEHIFSTSALVSHSYLSVPNNVYTAIRGEVFDLTEVSATHTQVVTVIPSKTILEYGGVDASNLFPVQVCRLPYLLAHFFTLLAGQRTLQRCFRFGQSMGPT